MEPTTPYRPRVSSETRRLLTAGVLAVAALWLLARFRFRELPATPNPIPAVLSQLNSGPKYQDLATEINQLQPRVEPLLHALEPAAAGSAASGSPWVTALRVHDDVAVTVLPAGSPVDHVRVLARDAASGLTVVRVPGQAPSPRPMPWTPRGLSQSRYLVASEVSPRGVSLRPAFVGSLDPTDSPLWSDPVWRVPDGSDLVSGTALFTDEAELVGMVVGSGVERAVVPAAVLFAEVNRLLERPKAMAGVLGVEVQALTEEIASATGASGGVVVTWVDSDGAAARSLMVGDVIEAVDGRPLVSRRRWDVRVARLAAGETLTVGVRRGGELRSEALMATAPAVPATTTSLGLSLRGRTGAGAEVTRVEPGSAADRAGLEVGDRITLVGTISAPTPAQIRSAFGAAVEGQRVMIAVTRGNAHHVTTLAR